MIEAIPVPSTRTEPTRVAIVTGSGRERIGNVVVRGLAASGYAVVVHYQRSADAAAETVADIRRCGGRAIAIQADVADEEEVSAMFDQVAHEFGRLDVLVTTASTWQPMPLDEVTAADVIASFQVNTLGSFLCARAAGRLMRNQVDGGAIITLGDWAIERPYTGYAAYFIAKGAIPTLTRMMARELSEWNAKIRVNCIHPGPVLLPPGASEDERNYLFASTLVKEIDCPEEILLAVRYLINSQFVTGVCLPVDGGRSIFAAGEDR